MSITVFNILKQIQTKKIIIFLFQTFFLQTEMEKMMFYMAEAMELLR
jgi:hypothetical protein